MVNENKHEQQHANTTQSLVEHEQIILEELHSNIKQSFDDLENGEVYSMNEVKRYIEI
ncbi:hypothetical protein NHG24_08215 [Aerococcaceae bacterium NML210727]|nr:hypothetical protein [Aerococcaceae bacterium NML210727]MCW6654877.1 hypothetical protein [Aerococcaceae bacterium NML201296]